MTPRVERPVARPRVEVRDVGPGDWAHVAQALGERGGCGQCWCMVWRLPRKQYEAGKLGGGNKRALARLVQGGEAHGELAFVDGEPIAWLHMGPKLAFAHLEASRVLRVRGDEEAWAITCFAVPAPWRKRGVATALLAGAVAQARRLGVRRLEGYPAVPSAAKRDDMPAVFAWTGVPALFIRAGFRKLRRPAGSRPIYVLDLAASGKAPRERRIAPGRRA